MAGALTVAMNQHLFSKELFLFFTSIAEYENICRIISKPTEKFDVERADGNRETQPGNYHCRLAWLRCNVSGITRVFLLLIGSCAEAPLGGAIQSCCLTGSQTPIWNLQRSTFRKTQAVFIQRQEVDVEWNLHRGCFAS